VAHLHSSPYTGLALNLEELCDAEQEPIYEQRARVDQVAGKVMHFQMPKKTNCLAFNLISACVE